MRNGLKQIVNLCCISFCFVSAASAFQPFKPIVYSPDGPTTFLGPTLQGTYAHWITSTTAFSLLGELGLKNYRAGLTLGGHITPNQHIKFSGEYLWQRLNYSFITGNHTGTWVQQGAVGGDYLLSLYGHYFHSFELQGYYSYAPSKNLNDKTGTSTINRIPYDFVNNRRIAGSTAGGVSPGINVNVWPNGVAGLLLNWDDVVYHKEFTANAHTTGFGGTVRLEQTIMEHARLNLSASFRKPFNNYQGGVTWDSLYYHGNWNAGIFAAYTSGKHYLPNSYNIGLNVNYLADCFISVPSVKNEMPQQSVYDPGFLAWISDPAVYMPQVLAIIDQNVRATCDVGGVAFFGVLTDRQVFGTGVTISFPTAQLFSGNNLIFSITTIPTLTLGDSIVVDPTTGVVTATVGGGGVHDIFYTVTVTATNACGSATSTPFVIRLNQFI